MLLLSNKAMVITDCTNKLRRQVQEVTFLLLFNFSLETFFEIQLIICSYMLLIFFRSIIMLVLSILAPLSFSVTLKSTTFVQWLSRLQKKLQWSLLQAGMIEQYLLMRFSETQGCELFILYLYDGYHLTSLW